MAVGDVPARLIRQTAGLRRAGMWVRENRTKGAIARLRFFELRGGSIVAAVALTALLCDGLAPLLSFLYSHYIIILLIQQPNFNILLSAF